MSYEATFTKKCEGKEVQVGYFRCSSGDSSVAFSLLSALGAPDEMYQPYSFPCVTVEADRWLIERALEYSKSEGPNYYLGDKPYYPVREVLQEVFDALSDEDKLEILLY